MRKTNYLNNKDLLAEIHKSKNSFCSYLQPEYHRYDIILDSRDEIFGTRKTEVKNAEGEKEIVDVPVIELARQAHAARISKEEYERRKTEGEKIKQADCEYPVDNVATVDLIFRVKTYDHIPDDLDRKKTPKTIADHKVKLNFPPFKHYKFNEDGDLICVGKSHWKGDLETGKFCKTQGQATAKLAKMWMKLCERYGTRSNVRGYTYNDEMQGQAVLQLTQIGLQFDESKSNNPFAYYTAVVTNSFVRVINVEKRNQTIRDDLLEINNMDPSFTRQQEGQWEKELKREQDRD